MNSCLYECVVMHRRLQPKRHEFVYRMFLFLFDLEELTEIERRIPFFSVNSPNLYALRNEDYFQFHSRGIRKNLETFLATQNFTTPIARVRLLTLPRLLGYTFNPISIFFCFDAEGRPATSVVQVGNTFGELKPYLVPTTPDAAGFHIRVPKNYYVSPFSELDLVFDFRFDTPGERLRVLIDDWRGDEQVLLSALTGQRLELDAWNLARLSIKYPLVTLKVIFLIHWEALRLWRKKIPFRMKETDSELQQGAHRVR
jgi:DUF1365 family protein